MNSTVKLNEAESNDLSSMPVSALDTLFDIARIRFIVEDGKITGIEI